MRIPATEEQKRAVIHALLEGYEKTKKSGGNQYGPLALWELKEYLDFLNKEERDPIDLFLEGKCPDCGVKLVYEVTCYCPKCNEEWWGDKVLKKFYKDASPKPLASLKR